MKKRRGLRFLPGGAGRYVETLLKCLEYVKERNPDRESLKRWFLEHFPQTHSEKAVGSYINMIANQLGLIKAENSKFILTHDGEKFLLSRDNRFLFHVLSQRVEGVTGMLRLVETPKTFSQIDLAMRTTFKWKTGAQTHYRLGWLESLGHVAKTGNTYSLTQAGKALVDTAETGVGVAQGSGKPTAIEEARTPSHNEIRDMISEIGAFEGWISEVEYPIDKMRLDVVWRRIRTGNPSFAFEVQIGGNFFEALTKLKHAWDKWNSKPFLVTTEKYESAARQLLEGSFHEIEHVTRIVNWKKIRDLYEAEKKAKDLKNEVGIV